MDALTLQHLPPSNGSNLAEPPNSSESHPEPDSSTIHVRRNTILGLFGERNEFNLDEQGLGERQGDSSNIAIHTLSSVSMGHSSHTPFPVQDMVLESSTSTSLQPSTDASNLHMTGCSNPSDSINLERSPVTGTERSSTPGQDIERGEDYSSRTHHEDGSTSITLRNTDQNEDRILTQRRHATVPSSLTEHQESGRMPAEADSHVVENLFHAFPETRLFRSVTFATVGFLIMTLMVLGNLIYTYRPLMLHNMVADGSIESWRLRKVHLRLMDNVIFMLSLVATWNFEYNVRVHWTIEVIGGVVLNVPWSGDYYCIDHTVK